jgi:hypothetical protein
VVWIYQMKKVFKTEPRSQFFNFIIVQIQYTQITPNIPPLCRAI